LRFGLRAKKIKNKPKINKEVTVAELKNEIERLEAMLAKSNRRVKMLEAFIRENNLSFEEDEGNDLDYDYHGDNTGIDTGIIRKDQNNTNTHNNQNETFIVRESLIPSLPSGNFLNQMNAYNPNAIGIKENPRITIGLGFNEHLQREQTGNDTKANENNYEKVFLNEKLEDIIKAIDNYSSIRISEKEELLNNLDCIKEGYIKSEAALQEKIKLTFLACLRQANSIG
jgi:hypothetical protein